MAGRERVAFLGLGIMGAPMAANVIRAGFDVTVVAHPIAYAWSF